MKLTLLPLAALASAFVLPDAGVMDQVAIQSRPHPKDQSPLSSLLEQAHEGLEAVEEEASDLLDSASNLLDHAIESVHDTKDKVKAKCYQSALDIENWLEDTASEVEAEGKKHHGHHGHHGHHKPNLTVYELIAKSKYTTKLAALVNEFDDLVELLNGTEANFTVFAPIDKAFERIPDKAPKPTKEQLKALLTYHVSGDFYPAGRVLVTKTIPSLLAGEGIGGKPQRLSTNIGFRGLTVNFFSRIIAVDIFGTNGVIHGIDHVLFPPPNAAEAIELFPGDLSTLALGLEKTGLIDAINDTDTHVGGTIFAPSNFAFQKLGPRLNGFLFSRYGLKYLRALLEYHVVADKTLYSDAYYEAKKSEETESIPKGYFHVDLPTLLKGKSLSVDVGRYGRLISIKINGFSDVTTADGVVYDGVIHVVSNVLIPPKHVDGVEQEYHGEEVEVEDLKDRLAPFVRDDTDEEQSFEEQSWKISL